MIKYTYPLKIELDTMKGGEWNKDKAFFTVENEQEYTETMRYIIELNSQNGTSYRTYIYLPSKANQLIPKLK
jgi:hypothetical protein